MKTVAIILFGLFTASCALREDGVRQCESRIRSRFDSPTFLKRLPNEIGDINTVHPNEEAGYNQRWIDINYESREPGMQAIAHRYQCVFRLDNGSVGTLVSAGDRDPRLLDYGKHLTAGK